MSKPKEGEHLIRLYREVFHSDAGQLVLTHLRQLHQQPLLSWCEHTNLLAHAAGRSDVITGIDNILNGHVIEIQAGDTYVK